MKVLRGLVAAFSQFSILPVPSNEEAPNAYSIGWLPLVGAVIGLAAGWAAYGVYVWTHSQVWCAIVAFVLSIVLSGAIHVDGFLDSCDALLAATTVERRLEIFKDPTHGTFAIVGMALLTVLWLAALYAIPAASMPIVLTLVGLLSRMTAVKNLSYYKHARTGAKYNWVFKLIGFAWFLPLGPFLGDSWIKVIPVLGAYLLGTAVMWLFSRRLGGGLTGDTYGATVVITEVTYLIWIALYPALMP